MSKPAQLPIYRAVERLMTWAIPVIERLPKSLPYQTLGGLLIRDIRECMDAVILTTQATDYTHRSPKYLDCTHDFRQNDNAGA